MYKSIHNVMEVSPTNARNIVLEHIGARDVTFIFQKLLAGDRPMYEMEFMADEMRYSCYVSAENGEILGLMSQPKAA